MNNSTSKGAEAEAAPFNKLGFIENVVRSEQLSSRAKLVVIALAGYADSADGGNAYPGQDNLIPDLGLSWETIRRALREAEDLGVIEVVQKSNNLKGLRTKYKCNMVDLPRRPRLKEQQDSSKVETASPAMVHADEHHKYSPTRTTGTRGRVLNPVIEPSHRTQAVIRSAGANRDSRWTGRPTKREDAAEVGPLPAGWAPNSTHATTHERLNLHDGLGDLVDDFRYRMVGENRTDWDSVFGAYLKRCADGRVDVTFPYPDDEDDDREDSGPDLVLDAEVVEIEDDRIAGETLRSVVAVVDDEISAAANEPCYQCRSRTPSPEPQHRGMCQRCYEYIAKPRRQRAIAVTT